MSEEHFNKYRAKRAAAPIRGEGWAPGSCGKYGPPLFRHFAPRSFSVPFVKDVALSWRGGLFILANRATHLKYGVSGKESWVTRNTLKDVALDLAKIARKDDAQSSASGAR